MYRFECDSCADDGTFEDLESAQSAFNEHARDQHEVVLRRVEPTSLEEDSSGPDGAPPADAPDADAEGNDPVAE